MTFYLNAADWAQAEKALQGKPSGTKFDKYVRDPITREKAESDLRSPNSFIIIDEVIYAISNRIHFLPQEGGTSLVKQGITKDGKRVGIKINSATELNDSEGYKAGKRNGLNKAQALRKEPNMSIKIPSFGKQIKTDSKLYTVMEWRGETLIDLLNKHQLTNIQKWLVGLRTCLAVNRIHEQGILHCDLKVENVTATIDGNYVTVDVVDFEYAMFIEDQQLFVSHPPRGTIGLMSREIFTKCEFSFLSDSYALGVMLLLPIDITCLNLGERNYEKFLDQANLQLHKGIHVSPLACLNAHQTKIDPELFLILSEMLATDRSLRSDSTKVIIYLCKKLENDSTLEQDIKDELKTIRSSMETKLIAKSPLIFSSPNKKIKNEAQAPKTDENQVNPSPVKNITQTA